jgi:hypothetical protein
LEEAESGIMDVLYQQKALGLENVARYQPVLSTIWNLADLFAARGHLDEANLKIYSRTPGFQAFLGPSSNKCQIDRSIASLDATHNKCRDISLLDRVSANI